MILLDASILIYSFRRDTDSHSEFRTWLETALGCEPAIGISDHILSSVVRIVTHPGIFAKPSTLQEVLTFCDFLLGHSNVLRVVPGAGHWGIFKELAKDAGAKGNLVADAFLAALAKEQGAELVTTDRDFARFAGLRWKHPLR